VKKSHDVVELLSQNTVHRKQKLAKFQVLVVLSRLHDPIDGMDLSALSAVEDHITQLLSTSGQSKPLPQFVCFACPAIFFDLEQVPIIYNIFNAEKVTLLTRQFCCPFLQGDSIGIRTIVLIS
jgi:hypothetical protein